MQYFYALIAMCCLMSVSSGVECIGTALANLSSLGMRRECAPTRKSVMILSDLAAAFVLQSAGVFLLFFYLTVILKLDFGNRLGLSFATALMGTLFSLAAGVFIGIAFKCSMHIKGPCPCIYDGQLIFCRTYGGNHERLDRTYLPAV